MFLVVGIEFSISPTLPIEAGCPMYGLVHTAIQDMIVSNHGEETWNRIRKQADVSDDAFLATQNYDDSIVLDLVAAASDSLDITAIECLDAFGQFWISDIAVKHYRAMLDGFGSDIFGFLENLDHMHDRISGTFLNYNAPSFRLERNEDGIHFLHYRSNRQGLTPFVIGLLKGLAIHFNTALDIAVAAEESSDAGQHTIFRLTVNNVGG